MIFERIEDPGLSHYSYVLGCLVAGEMAVVDPRRDVDVYLRFAEAQGMRITHVLETHIHADFASGARELAELTGATHHVSKYDAGERYEVQFKHQDLGDGDLVTMGNVKLQARHTPGHTPEHLAFLVYDGARSTDMPLAMLSGDFLFVGSLGRPDLLGDEAKLGLAKQQYASVRALDDLPDGIEVHPAHGAGSMCGAGMSGRPMSTLGYERIANPYLNPALSEAEFVARLLGSVPPFPPYYRRMKELNSVGPALLHGLPGQTALRVGEVKDLIAREQAVVVDLRDSRSFGRGHIPGAFAIVTSVSTYASWVVPYERPIVLVAQSPGRLPDALRALVRVGLDDLRGFLDGGMEAWLAAGEPVEALPAIAPADLAEALAAKRVHLLDVRNNDEIAAGHVAGAQAMIYGQVADRLAELPGPDTPVAVICATGNRSTVAASVLQRAGYAQVFDAAGGFAAWRRAGLPVEMG